MRFNSYNVRPRYSAGSPAMLDEAKAIHVARQEWEGYKAAREGIYGPEKKAEAHRLGMRGIAYALYETRTGWRVHDLLTGEVYERPSDERLRKQGWKLWYELPDWAHEHFADSKPPDTWRAPVTLQGGVFQAWFKVARDIERWEPEIIEVREDELGIRKQEAS